MRFSFFFWPSSPVLEKSNKQKSSSREEEKTYGMHAPSVKERKKEGGGGWGEGESL